MGSSARPFDDLTWGMFMGTKATRGRPSSHSIDLGTSSLPLTRVISQLESAVFRIQGHEKAFSRPLPQPQR